MAVAEAKGRDGPDFFALPEGCIARVVSFTTPPDACRFSSVSLIFKSACDSDVVWASFLPPDCRSMVPWSISSLKELYFSLCDDPVLVGDGKMSFSMDRHGGKISIMLSARALFITGGDTPTYWTWKRMPNSRIGRDTPTYWSWKRMPISRFAEVAELNGEGRLEIRGTISSRMLSTGTLYSAYLVFKFTPKSRGIYRQSVEVGAGFAGDEVAKRERFSYLTRVTKKHRRWAFLIPDVGGWDKNYPKERADRWSEIESGEFVTEDGVDGEVEMSVLESKGDMSMGRFVVEGIEIRPKYRK